MHDVLRTRVLRKLESLPEDQVYQVLDYIEFLESKYASDNASDPSALQSFAEKLEDQLRRKTVSPGSLREAFQLISAADKVLSNVANLGKEFLGDANGSSEGKGGRKDTPPKTRSGAGSTRAGKDSKGPAGGSPSG